MAYASDHSLLESVLRRHGISWATSACARPAWTTPCGSAVAQEGMVRIKE